MALHVTCKSNKKDTVNKRKVKKQFLLYTPNSTIMHNIIITFSTKLIKYTSVEFLQLRFTDI